MKPIKRFARIILLLAITNMASAQANWLTGGDPIIGNGNILGTTSAGTRLNIWAGNVQRMRLDGNNGFLGLGNAFGGNAPQNLLHLFSNITGTAHDSVFMQFSNNIQGGATPTDGFILGINYNAYAEFKQYGPNLPVSIWEQSSGGPFREATRVVTKTFTVGTTANGPTGVPTSNIARMGIWSGINGVAGLNPVPADPVSMLQIGDYWPTTLTGYTHVGGYRDWMNVGTYMTSTSDNMYVGLRTLAPDVTLAEIDWGNNPSSQANGDVLVFNFAGADGNGVCSSYPGLEVARMWTDGNNGRMGLGGWSQAGVDNIGGGGLNNNYTGAGGGGGVPGNTLEINSPATVIGPTNSGLRFTDLNSTATPIANPGPGVLAVNAQGDVVYVNESLGANLCPNLTPIPFGQIAGYQLTNFNDFYFGGQGGNNMNAGDVAIGLTCSQFPIAKLHVLQNAVGLNNSTGIYVENDDKSNGTSSAYKPLVGIASFIPKAPGIAFYNIAGWFDAQSYQNEQFSVFVPNNGGCMSIGWPLGTVPAPTGQLFQVNGTVITKAPYVSISDRQLKQDTLPYYGGLSLIRQLQPITYKFNGKAGLDSSDGPYIGVIAENVRNVVPLAVDTFYAKLDSTDAQTTTLLGIRSDALMYTTMNAVKQLDSIVQNKPSGVSGSGTANFVPKFLKPDSVGNSQIQDNGTNVTMGSNISFSPAASGTVPAMFLNTASQTQLVLGNNTAVNDFQLVMNLQGSHGIDGLIQYSSTGQVLNLLGGLNTPVFRQYDNTGATINQFCIGQNYITGGPLSVGEAGNGLQGNMFEVNTTGGADGITLGYNGTVTANLQNDGGQVGSLRLFNSSVTQTVKITGSGNTYFNGGNIGIGNPNPTANLDLVNNTSNVQVSQGISSVVNGTNNAVNYGIYAAASGANVNYAGYFNGDVYTTGSYLPSDENLKTNIDSTHLCSNLLCKLKPCTFNYNSTYPSLNLPTGTCYGLIAQDVQNVFPQLVHNVIQPAQIDTAGDTLQHSVSFKTVNYTGFIPLLIKGYQDQQKKIDSLSNVLSSLQSCINNLCANRATKVNPADSNTTSNTQNVVLSSVNSALLYQNTPNPFSTGTKINYFLPEGTTGAMMLFFDMYGNKIKEVQLQQTGLGTLNITPDNLKDGVYSYSLIVNGTVIDTKKMVLQK